MLGFQWFKKCHWNFHFFPFTASFYIIEGCCHVTAKYILSGHFNKRVALLWSWMSSLEAMGEKSLASFENVGLRVLLYSKKFFISTSHRARMERNLRNFPYHYAGKITVGSPLVIQFLIWVFGIEHLVVTHPNFLPFHFKWNHNSQTVKSQQNMSCFLQ